MKEILFLFLSLWLIIISCNSVKITDDEKIYLLENSNKNKYYLINFINENQGKLGKLPSIMIDGSFVIFCDRENTETINLKKENIKKLELMTIEKSIPLFGSAGKNGIVKISTY